MLYIGSHFATINEFLRTILPTIAYILICPQVSSLNSACCFAIIEDKVHLRNRSIKCVVVHTIRILLCQLSTRPFPCINSSSCIIPTIQIHFSPIIWFSKSHSDSSGLWGFIGISHGSHFRILTISRCVCFHHRGTCDAERHCILYASSRTLRIRLVQSIVDRRSTSTTYRTHLNSQRLSLKCGRRWRYDQLRSDRRSHLRPNSIASATSCLGITRLRTRNFISQLQYQHTILSLHCSTVTATITLILYSTF